MYRTYIWTRNPKKASFDYNGPLKGGMGVWKSNFFRQSIFEWHKIVGNCIFHPFKRLQWTTIPLDGCAGAIYLRGKEFRSFKKIKIGILKGVWGFSIHIIRFFSYLESLQFKLLLSCRFGSPKWGSIVHFILKKS